MVRLDTVLLKTASRCNFDCTYCYVYRGRDTSWRGQPSRMSREVISAICDSLARQADDQEVGFATVLHGGEPLLLGFDDLAMLLHGLRDNLPSERYPISIQTNGALLSSRLLDLFADTRTGVSVSIDGPAVANDIARLDRRGNSTHAATIQGIRQLRDRRDRTFLFAGTLSVIQPQVPPDSVYRFLKDLGSPSMDFLLQDGNHDHLPPGKSSFQSTEYGDWLSALLDLYLSDDSPVPIRVFDDMIKLCVGGESRKEGIGDAAYSILIIETNGEIRKNDTLRSSYDGADSFSSRWNVLSTSIAEVLSSEEFTEYAGMQTPTATACRECRLLSVCGGGMPLYRWSSERAYDNPSVYCYDHAKVIRRVMTRLTEYGVASFPVAY